MFDYVTMGNRMYEARVKKNIKQHEMGKLLKVSQTTYSGYENGTRKIEIDRLYKLSEVLDVPVYWLLGLDFKYGLTDAEMLKLEDYKRFLISERYK